MPLNRAALDFRLTSLFTNPPDGFDGCAQAWADAVGDLARAIVPPSTTVSSAISLLQSRLTTIFSTNTPTGNAAQTAIDMELAFKSFAALVGVGMSPTYTAVPPAGPVGFASLLATAESSVPPAVSKFGNAIEVWMRTGTATLTTTPFTTVPWS